MKRIAVIGAGLSGLVFARSLGDSAAVTPCEKSRGYGGRIIGKWVSLCPVLSRLVPSAIEWAGASLIVGVAW